MDIGELYVCKTGNWLDLDRQTISFNVAISTLCIDLHTNIRTLPIDTVDKQFNRSDMITRQKHPRRFLDTIFDEC